MTHHQPCRCRRFVWELRGGGGRRGWKGAARHSPRATARIACPRDRAGERNEPSSLDGPAMRHPGKNGVRQTARALSEVLFVFALVHTRSVGFRNARAPDSGAYGQCSMYLARAGIARFDIDFSLRPSEICVVGDIEEDNSTLLLYNARRISTAPSSQI